MTHHCNCGKIIHWPKDAKAGDVWVCRRCGTRNRLVRAGEGGERPVVKKSRKSAASSNPDLHKGASSGSSSRTSSSSSSSGSRSSSSSSYSGSQSSSSSPSSGGSGCLVMLCVIVIVIISVMGAVAAIFIH